MVGHQDRVVIERCQGTTQKNNIREEDENDEEGSQRTAQTRCGSYTFSRHPLVLNRFVLLYFAIANMNDAVSVPGNIQFMRHHNDGIAFLVKPLE